MKKIIYTFAISMIVGGVSAQTLLFSWSANQNAGMTQDSVHLYAQNPGMADVYLMGWNSLLYYVGANVQVPPPASDITFTLRSELLDAGLQHLGVGNAAIAPALTVQGVSYDRKAGVAPFCNYEESDGFLIEGGAPIAPDPNGEESLVAPVRLGSYRFTVVANQGGTGCFVSAPFEGAQQYTTSTVPTATQGVPPQGPCANGCFTTYAGQSPIPEQASCCATCGPLFNFVLSADLVDFKASRYQQTSAVVSWQTANEENVSHFEIERTKDKANWELVAKAAPHANGHNINAYTLLDSDVYDGRSARAVFFYRLKIVDNDGSFKYSGIQAVRFTTSSSVFGAYVYPNPSSEFLTVELNYAEDSAPVSDLLIYNNLGQLVYSQEVADGQDVVYLNHSSTGLVAGSYILELRDVNNNPLSQDKIVVQR